jgi:type I restriction enzyme S subunit
MASEFPQVKLGSICKLRSGYSFKSSEWIEAGEPVIKIANVKSGRIIRDGCAFVSPASAAKAKEWYTQPGDILIAMTGYVGELAWVQKGERYLINQRVGRFDNIDETRVYKQFLFYALRHPEIRSLLETIARGSAQPNLSAGDAHGIEIPLPSFEDQRVIAEVLTALDDKIAQLRETNATLEAIAQALFKSWFVDFDPVGAKAEGRDPEGVPPEVADLFPSEFEDSELGAIPKGWRVGALGDLVSLRNERIKPSLITEALPYVPIECIPAKSMFLQESKPGSEAQSSLILFKQGDILFGAMRPYFHKVCLASWEGVTRTTVFVCTPRDAKFRHYSLLRLFQSETIEFATTHSEGSTIPYAKWAGSMESMKVPLPPPGIAQAFGDLISPLFSKGLENAQMASCLGNLRDTLLPRLMSGKLRILSANEVSA